MGWRMRTYTIIGGVNGVGKSSFTGILKEQRSDLGILIDVVKITAELGGNTLAGDKAALKKSRTASTKAFRSHRKPPSQAATQRPRPGNWLKRGIMSGCIISAWTAPKKAFPALPTGSSVAGMIFLPRTWSAALLGAGKL